MVGPTAWNLCDIGSLAVIYSGATPSTNNPAFWNGGIVWVTPSDITGQQTKYLTSSERRISLEGLQNCSTALLPKGTILLCTRATIGVMSIADKEVTTNQGFKNLICNKDTSNEFVYYALQMLKDEMVGKSIGTTFLELSKSELSKIKMLIPKDKEEQTAIAEALSDADNLIASLEKLIAKKKAIKQGAMQELLTGKKRLSGFNGEWIEKPLAELFVFSGGVSASRDQLSDKGYYYLHYGDIHSAVKSNIDTVADAFAIPKLDIDISKVPTSALLRDGDVVFVDASEDDEGASKHIVVRNESGSIYIAGLHTVVAKSLGYDIDNHYKEYCFKTEEIKAQFKYYCAGTKVTGISKTNITKIVLRFPVDTIEQSAIASILSDMDAEIEHLEKKLAKYRLIKQGMMQELLTGRIRLIETNKKAETAPKGHNQQYDDAIAISAIVNAFYDDRFILGRVKVQKLLYLLRRKQDADVSAFKKKAAGPYNEKARYKGGESIAIKSGYIAVERNDKGSKFSKGRSIDTALKYVGNMQPDIDWLLEKFRFHNTNKDTKNLEVLATVDMAVCELEKSGKTVNLDAVKDVIGSNKEWAPKLQKPYFTDTAIRQAISESNELFN